MPLIFANGPGVRVSIDPVKLKERLDRHNPDWADGVRHLPDPRLPSIPTATVWFHGPRRAECVMNRETLVWAVLEGLPSVPIHVPPGDVSFAFEIAPTHSPEIGPDAR